MDITMRARIVLGLRELKDQCQPGDDRVNVYQDLEDLFMHPPQKTFNELADVIREMEK